MAMPSGSTLDATLVGIMKQNVTRADFLEYQEDGLKQPDKLMPLKPFYRDVFVATEGVLMAFSREQLGAALYAVGTLHPEWFTKDLPPT